MAMLESYGGWAVVTGASAGHRRGVCAGALPRSGVNLVLTARREERLRTLATDLETRHEIADPRRAARSRSSMHAPARLVEATADLDVGFVLNNAGFGVAGRFEQGSVRARARDGSPELRDGDGDLPSVSAAAPWPGVGARW